MHPEHQIRDAGELAKGQIDVSSLKVKEHHTRVFDMMNEEDRRLYDMLYVELSELTRSGKAIIITNSREILSRSDGSTGWSRFLEWAVFDTSEILGA